MSNTGQAWVTLATNDSYALGALVLANSLKRNNTIHQLAILITPGVSPAMKEALASTFDLLKEVDVLDSQDAANLALMARPDLGITFTKLHCWNLTQYSKCVFLDADTLVIKNCDELFEREELSAAPDAGWPDCFNSGVFVYKPSEATFKALLDFALTTGSFDGGDQGLLNLFFGDWATKDITKHLPFIYNMVATATYSYLPAFKAFGGNVKIAHFIGSSKPWLQILPTGSSLSSFLDLWWNIFRSDVSQTLTTNMSSLDLSMAGRVATVQNASIINCTVFEEGPQASKSFSTPVSPPPPTVKRHVFVDPWDYVQQRQPRDTDKTQFNTEDVIDQLVEHLRRTHQEPPSQSYPSPIHQNQLTYTKQLSTPNLSHNKEHFQTEATQTYSNMANDMPNKTQSLQQLHPRPLQNHNGQLYTQKEDIHEEPLRRVESYENIPKTISPPITPTCVEQSNFLSKSEEPKAATEEGGLAGALAGGQKEIIEDQWRKQSWEQGNIDYMGQDAFENILKKISKTVGEDIKPLEASVQSTTELATKSEPSPKVPEVPDKTEDKTDSPKIDAAQADERTVAPSVAAPEPSEEATKPEAPKAEPVAPSEIPEASKTEAVPPPEAPVAPKAEVVALPEVTAEDSPKATTIEPTPHSLDAEALPPQVPEVKLDTTSTPATTESETVSAVPATVVPEPRAPVEPVPEQPVAVPVDPSVPQPAQIATPTPALPQVPSSPTGDGATTKESLPESAAVVPPAAVSPVALPEPVPQPPQPADTKTATPPPPDKKDPPQPKDDSALPGPPKDGGAEKVAAPVEAAPPSPSVPSPAKPEGTKVDVTQGPALPPLDTQSTAGAEASTPPLTPTGDAPVPPKRRSTKGKGKK